MVLLRELLHDMETAIVDSRLSEGVSMEYAAIAYVDLCNLLDQLAWKIHWETVWAESE